MKSKVERYIERGKYNKLFDILKKDWVNNYPKLEQSILTLMQKEDAYLIENLKKSCVIDNLLKEKNIIMNPSNLITFFAASDDFFKEQLMNVFYVDFNMGIEIVNSCESREFAYQNASEKINEIINENKDELIKLANHNNFVVDEKGVIINYLPELLFVSKKNDEKLTKERINSDEFIGAKNLFKRILEENIDVKQLKNVNINEVEEALTSLEKDTQSFLGENYDKLSKESQELLIDLKLSAIFNKAPALIPQYVLESEIFLDRVIKNEDEKNIIKMVTKKSEYLLSEEEELLKFYGSKCSNVEQHLKELAKSGTVRENMTLFDCLALTMYAKKLLFENGIKDYKINTFAYADNKKTLGGIISGVLDIYVNNETLTVERIIRTLFHEVAHAIQKDAIDHGKIDIDVDLATYQKDRVLQRLIGKEQYYNKNYLAISFEFDADIKAEILCAEFLGYKEKLLQKYIKFGKDELRKNEIYLKQLKRKIDYVDSKIRIYNGKKYTLERLFLEKVGEYMARGNSISSLIPSDSILGLEYNFFPIIKRKSVPELFKIANKLNDDELLQNKYLKIIEQRLIKENDEEYRENLLFLKEVIQKEKCTKQIKVKIENILNRRSNYYTLKVEKYSKVHLSNNKRK